MYIEKIKKSQPKRVLEKNGEILAISIQEKSTDCNLNVSYDEHIYKTLFFIEDKGFENHVGLSLRGIVRALVVNLKKRKISQGGSTITQQLVRTIFPVRNRLLRKLIELLLAPIFTVYLGRKKIVNAYLQLVYFGKNISGIETASQIFFRKSSEQILAHESLILYSLLSKPNYWLKHPESLLRKCIKIAKEASIKEATSASIRQSIRKLVRNYVKSDIYPQWFPKLKEYGAHVFNDLPNGFSSVDGSLQRQLYYKFNRYKINVCFGVIDHRKFQLKALVDNLNIDLSKYPTLFTSSMDVGSLLKPFLLVTALESGLDPASIFFDSKNIKICFEGFPSWNVKNYQNIYRGRINLEEGVLWSDNSVCVQALRTIGYEKFLNTLYKFEILNPSEKVTPSIILGTSPGGINYLNILRFYSELASLYRSDSNCFSIRNKKENPMMSLETKIRVRKVLAKVVTMGTGSFLKNKSIIGAKTGSAKNLNHLICFDRENLYFIIHKEKEKNILREQYLSTIYKSYGIVQFSNSFISEVKKFYKALVTPDSLFGKGKKVA